LGYGTLNAVADLAWFFSRSLQRRRTHGPKRCPAARGAKTDDNKTRGVTKMKKLMSIVVSLLFALSMTGLAFAQAKTDKPASEPTVKAEKAEKKKVVKKDKKASKAKKATTAKKKGKTEEAAPAAEKK
jgi:hypothetical protein